MSSADPTPGTLAALLATATQQLQQAGVPSPQADAVALAAHLAGVSPGVVRAHAMRSDTEPPWAAHFRDLVGRRAAREPLQLIIGQVDFAGVQLVTRTGVFIPRPETELLACMAADLGGEVCGSPQGQGLVAVDLCTGSGAIAAVLATRLPQAHIYAIESDPTAAELARTNLAGRAARAQVILADALTWNPGFSDGVGLVTCNPPYVPDDDVLAPEVSNYDPPAALYGGGVGGTEMPLAVLDHAARLLGRGGYLVMEHGADQGDELLAAARRTGAYEQCCVHHDLAGRPRILVARRGGRALAARSPDVEGS